MYVLTGFVSVFMKEIQSIRTKWQNTTDGIAIDYTQKTKNRKTNGNERNR